MGAQNFNFATKFFQNAGFSPKFYIIRRKFSDNFPTAQNSWCICPLARLPLPSHNATGYEQVKNKNSLPQQANLYDFKVRAQDVVL